MLKRGSIVLSIWSGINFLLAAYDIDQCRHFQRKLPTFGDGV